MKTHDTYKSKQAKLDRLHLLNLKLDKAPSSAIFTGKLDMVVLEIDNLEMALRLYHD